MNIHEHRRFDEPPFSEDWIACGINASIELFNIPVEKLKKVDSDLIATKLVNLINKTKKLESECGHAVQLQNYIDMICDKRDLNSDVVLDQIIKMSEQKYMHWINTRELI